MFLPSFVRLFLPSFLPSLFVYLFICFSSLLISCFSCFCCCCYYCHLSIIIIIILSFLYLTNSFALRVYAGVAEWSKAIVSGTILLFEGAGSNPASCILGREWKENAHESRALNYTKMNVSIFFLKYFVRWMIKWIKMGMFSLLSLSLLLLLLLSSLLFEVG